MKLIYKFLILYLIQVTHMAQGRTIEKTAMKFGLYIKGRGFLCRLMTSTFKEDTLVTCSANFLP